MSTSPKNKIRSRKPLWVCILVVLGLYTVQGATLGMATTIPLYLASFGATWQQQGTLSFVMYPFTMKLLWAPFIDVFYIRQLGRRKTWLLPVQVILSITFIVLSFYLEFLLVQLRIIQLTVIFFFIILLTATHDICVDGWALTLFGSSNAVWQATSQLIGQNLGSFFSSSGLLILESANMTNKLIRQPLGLAVQSYGLFTLAQFVRFWSIMFLVAAFVVAVLFRQQQQNDSTDEKDHLNLLETYLYILRLLKKKCFRQFIVILLGQHAGYAATSAMTFVVLISRGMIRRDTLGLITMPLILIKLTAPFLLSRTQRPLIVYAQWYVPGLIICMLIAIFVFFCSHLQSYPTVFYVLLIILLGIRDVCFTIQNTACGSFYAYISDTRVGSTYYTLVASLTNLGHFVSSSVVLYTANWLPKEQAYYIEVGVCILLGCIWLSTSWRLMHRLQMLPIERWHLLPRKRQLHEDYRHRHQTMTMDNRKMELSTITRNMDLSSWL